MATFTNQATLTYNGGPSTPTSSRASSCRSWTASKTAAAESYRTGDLVTYVVQLRSTRGAAALTGLTVTDHARHDELSCHGGTVQLTPLTYQAGTLRYFMNGVRRRPRRLGTGQTASASTESAFRQAALPRWPIRPASMPLPISRQRARSRTP